MEKPKAVLNDISTRIFQKDVSFQVPSNFLGDEEQTKAQMAMLWQEMKNLRSELQEHRVNAVEANPRTVDPKQKGRQNANETKNWNALKTKELLRKKSALIRITTKNDDQILDQINGLEAKTSKKETKITILMDLEEVFPHLIRISLQDETSHMRITTRTMEDQMINSQISHSTEATETDPQMDISIIRMGPGETMETSFVLHRLKGEASRKIVHTASQQVISLTILLTADMTIDLRWVLHLTNKNSRKTATRRHLIRFVSPQPTKPSTNYQNSVR